MFEGVAKSGSGLGVSFLIRHLNLVWDYILLHFLYFGKVFISVHMVILVTFDLPLYFNRRFILFCLSQASKQVWI